MMIVDNQKDIFEYLAPIVNSCSGFIKTEGYVCFRPLIGVIISNQGNQNVFAIYGALVSVPLSGLSFLICY